MIDDAVLLLQDLGLFFGNRFIQQRLELLVVESVGLQFVINCIEIGETTQNRFRTLMTCVWQGNSHCGQKIDILFGG